MKVECTQLISSTTSERVRNSYWLTVGRVYTVLALSATPGREVLLRIVGDDGTTPGLYASTLFETVDDAISPEWVIKIEDTGMLHLSPKQWLRDGFWEDYFDGHASARAEFNVARRAIDESADGPGGENPPPPRR